MEKRQNNTSEVLLWLVPIVGSAHVLEEYALNWKAWAEDTLGFTGLSWELFFLTNAAMIVVMICHAGIGWRLPAVSLSGSALITINALCFHLLPTLGFQIYSPGTVTAVALYLPVAFLVYRGARRDGVLTRGAIMWSIVIGAIMMFGAAFLASHARV